MGNSFHVDITGYVGSDPQVRDVGEQRVASFSVAVSKKNRAGQKLTNWYRINCWNKLADVAEQYVHKGSLVQVMADWMRHSAWIDQTGTPVPSNDIDAARLILLDRVGAVDTPEGEEDVDDIPF